MIKIGDFSRMTQVPVSTLRYYDDVGLLKPVEVDRFTGYRYYALDQLPRLHRLLALKDLGFSLEQIGRLLDQELPAAELRGMLRLKETELQAHIQDELARLERVQARLRQIEQEANPPVCEVLVRAVPAMLVASIRGVVPSYEAEGALWDELDPALAAVHVTPCGPAFTLYHAAEPEIDVEVCHPVARPFPVAGRVQVRELPAVEHMACAVHHGPYSTLIDAYEAAGRWMESGGWSSGGLVRQVYLRMARDAHDAGAVTEIQIPIDRA